LAECISRDAAMDKHKNLLKDDELDHILESSLLPGTHQARISELAELVFKDTAMDKHRFF
jgi:hypothetical protein